MANIDNNSSGFPDGAVNFLPSTGNPVLDDIQNQANVFDSFFDGLSTVTDFAERGLSLREKFFENKRNDVRQTAIPTNVGLPRQETSPVSFVKNNRVALTIGGAVISVLLLVLVARRG